MSAEVTLSPGTKVQMVVSNETYDAIVNRGEMNFVGNLAAFDDVPNQVFARNNLAIIEGFKKNVDYVVELELIKPLNAQIGIVGAQGSAIGGSSQVSFLFEQRNEGEFFKLVGSRELP
ncbi:MAG: hypothetical protein LBF16_02035 [Pseudomonadales bacterium]|nr:hypothetical protein [Pseudomonadales bacterium]